MSNHVGVPFPLKTNFSLTLTQTLFKTECPLFSN
jgi:hypothetical protein